MWFWILLAVVLAFWHRRRLRYNVEIDDLSSRHVFITGCDSGFGRRLAERLVKKGVTVYAACLKESSVQELRDKFGEFRMKSLKLDVTDPEEVKSAAEFVKTDLGDKGLWALVNNSGIRGEPCPFYWLNKQDFAKVFGVNFFGLVDVTMAMFPILKRGREGRIVNMASYTGRIGLSASPYVSSKFAVEGFSDGLSVDMAPYNISVHTIEPGAFRTNIIEGFDISITRRWNALSPAVRDNMGEGFLKNTLDVLNRFHETASRDLDLVVDAQEHAVLGKYPRERYVIGNDARFLFVPLSFFPVWIQKLVLKYLGYLAGIKLPLPADAAKKH